MFIFLLFPAVAVTDAILGTSGWLYFAWLVFGLFVLGRNNQKSGNRYSKERQMSELYNL